MRWGLVLLAACASPPPICTKGQMPHDTPSPPDPIAGLHVHGHAHNDYAHAHPLLDALDHHFYSVEADLWYDAGNLSISHDGAPYRGTLAGLYLDPLASLVTANGGSVYGDGVAFRLVIDIKDNTAALPQALHDLIASYALPIEIVVSGNDTMKRAFVAIEPQLGVRDSNHFALTDAPADARWTDYALDWDAYVASDRDLGCLVDDAHALGRSLRLWNTPDDVGTWAAELAAGVDYINTDDLAGLDAFFASH